MSFHPALSFSCLISFLLVSSLPFPLLRASSPTDGGGHEERTVSLASVNESARACAALLRALFRAMRLPDVRGYVLRSGRGVKSLSWIPGWILKEGPSDCLSGDYKSSRRHPTLARAHDAAVAALAEARALQAVSTGQAPPGAFQREQVIAQYSSGDIRHEVFGAGVQAANGVYRWLGWAQGAKMFVRRVNRSLKYTVFRCKLEKGGLQVRAAVFWLCFALCFCVSLSCCVAITSRRFPSGHRHEENKIK